MLTTLILAIAVASEQTTNPIILDCIRDGYALEIRKYRPPTVDSINLSLHDRNVLRISPAPRKGEDPLSLVERQRKMSARPAARGLPMPDSMPVGMGHICGVNQAGGFFYVVGDQWVLRSHLRPVISKKGKSAVFHDVEQKMIDRFIPIVRWQLAIMEGDSLATLASYTSLSSFAKANQFKLWENVDKARYALDTPKGQVLLPLGSPKAKIGSEWVDAGGMIVVRAGQVLIPKQLADRID